MKLNEKQRFVLRNSLRALLWLSVFVALFLFIGQSTKGNQYVQLLEPIYEHTGLMFTIFLISEVIIGIIPPEIFIIWSLRFGELASFVSIVFLLASISYLAGIIGYFIGRYLHTTRFYRFLRVRFLRKMEVRLQNFGKYLIIIAALTPLPFSGVSMLVGSVKYPFKYYFLLSLTRYLRFIIYGIVFWEFNLV
ncbi:MAG: VTT domain-containing protein [Bacteroidales bacterium]|nr:VTT domain-containing protein [Bacteroidales bacterium]